MNTGADERFIPYDPAVQPTDCTTKIKVESDGDTSSTVDTPAGAIGNHNSLQGLQGGLPTERYHLAKADYDGITNSTNLTADNPVATLADLAAQHVDLSTFIQNQSAETQNAVFKISGPGTIQGDAIYSTIASDILSITSEDFSIGMSGGGWNYSSGSSSINLNTGGGLTIYQPDGNLSASYSQISGSGWNLNSGGLNTNEGSANLSLSADVLSMNHNGNTVSLQPQALSGSQSGATYSMSSTSLSMSNSASGSSALSFNAVQGFNSAGTQGFGLSAAGLVVVNTGVNVFQLSLDSSKVQINAQSGKYIYSNSPFRVNNAPTDSLDVLRLAEINASTPPPVTITPAWTLYNADGSTPYSILPTSSSKNIVVDKGVEGQISATYLYTTPTSGQVLPTSITGDFPTPDQGPDTPSLPLELSSIVATATYSVTLGVNVTGLKANLSTGVVGISTTNMTTSDSISITFKGRSYFGYSASTSLSSSDIIALANKAFATSRARNFTGVTATTGMYAYYVYDASFGDLTNVILDGAESIYNPTTGGAFVKLTDVTITNDAGISVLMRVYRSVDPQAFTNNTLNFL